MYNVPTLWPPDILRYSHIALMFVKKIVCIVKHLRIAPYD